MPAVRAHPLFQQYEARVEPVGLSFVQESGMTMLLNPAIDPILLELVFRNKR